MGEPREWIFRTGGFEDNNVWCYVSPVNRAALFELGRRFGSWASQSADQKAEYWCDHRANCGAIATIRITRRLEGGPVEKAEGLCEFVRDIEAVLRTETTLEQKKEEESESEPVTEPADVPA